MVPIEVQNTYLSEAIKNEKLNAFYCLLQSTSISNSEQDLAEIDKIYYNIINSISENNKQKFNENYLILSRRTPGDNSPFVHNDLLIFSIIVGLFKFSFSRDWIKTVIAKRSKSSITTTFDNIINENYQSKSNNQEITTVFLHLLDNQTFPDDILEDAYKGIINNQNLYQGKNDFNSLIAIKAFEIIITIKEIGDRGEYSYLKEFESRFKKRIKIVSKILYIILLIAIFYYLIQLATDLTEKNKALKDFLGNADLVLGILGYSLATGLFAIFRKKVELFMLWLFGYNNR
jgi:hypothetical protein